MTLRHDTELTRSCFAVSWHSQLVFVLTHVFPNTACLVAVTRCQAHLLEHACRLALGSTISHLSGCAARFASAARRLERDETGTCVGGAASSPRVGDEGPRRWWKRGSRNRRSFGSFGSGGAGATAAEAAKAAPVPATALPPPPRALVAHARRRGCAPNARSSLIAFKPPCSARKSRCTPREMADGGAEGKAASVLKQMSLAPSHGHQACGVGEHMSQYEDKLAVPADRKA